ncbi:hypothetical protein DPMN_001189 [Dreissena polymorpha]|uniref:Uncharacterized protein n=1 Tax=Dreissena polymorpha TaxID=45954 RepID=A0A9D4MJF4_DREPO|nr:hypothetical protein DPMN_001189 [Dreissena polymorpha]
MHQNATFNRIEPLKRPRSAMAPVILVDRQGNVRLVTGAAGGGRIPSAIAQVREKRRARDWHVNLYMLLGLGAFVFIFV